MVFYHLRKFLKTKFLIMSLLNDLGINKVSKENKKQE
jgi:hypothetical protein